MAKVTGYTKERMDEIVLTTIVSGTINDEGRLLLVMRNGESIDAGIVAGAKGDPGSGVTGVDISYQRGLSGTIEPTGVWTDTIPAVPAGQYLWVRTITTYTDPNDPSNTFTTTSFTVTQQPSSGPPGNDGRGVVSTTVEYQAGNSGVNPPGGTWYPSPPIVNPGQYLWTRTTIKYTEGDDTVLFTVSRQGADGAPGDPGVSNHIHVAYANSADGTVDFSTTDPSGRSYMGVSIDENVPDPTTPASYTWSRIQGAQGVGISTTVVHYQASVSGTTPPTDTWLTVVPSVPAGQYLWTRTVINFTDGAAQTMYTVTKQGEKGDPGDPGDTGNGVIETTIAYQVGSSGTTRPTGTWLSDIPTVPAGQYLWTRTTMVFGDGTSIPTYSVSRQALDGNDGVGISYIETMYQSSSSGTAPPSGEWSESIPVLYAGTYLWTRIKTYYTDTSVSTSYNVSRNGDDGTPGSPGSTGVSVTSITMYYYLATTAPAKPTVMTPPAPWTASEPTYTPGSPNNLYQVPRTVFSNGTFSYGNVSTSAAFTAAKNAYTKSESVLSLAEGLYQSIPSTTPPTSSPAGALKAGDQWIKIGTGEFDGRMIGMAVWNGSAWQDRQMVASSVLVPGSVGNAEIKEGAFNGVTFTGNRFQGAIFEGTEMIGSTFRLAGLSDATKPVNDNGSSVAGWAAPSGGSVALDTSVKESGTSSIRFTGGNTASRWARRTLGVIPPNSALLIEARIRSEIATKVYLGPSLNATYPSERGPSIDVPANTWTTIKYQSTVSQFQWTYVMLGYEGTSTSRLWVDKFIVDTGKPDTRELVIERDVSTRGPVVVGLDGGNEKFKLQTGAQESPYGGYLSLRGTDRWGDYYADNLYISRGTSSLRLDTTGATAIIQASGNWLEINNIGKTIRAETKQFDFIVGNKSGTIQNDAAIYQNGLASSLVPIGSMLDWATDTAPDGWLLCNGQLISRLTYALLFSVIGTRFGAGNGTSTFQLPDFRGKVAVGLDTTNTNFNTIGKEGGSETQSLTVAQLPSHNHASAGESLFVTTDRGEMAKRSGSTYTSGAWTPAVAETNKITNVSGTANTGSGAAHNNLQPYVTVGRIIKF